jgi:hypothetical protein
MAAKEEPLPILPQIELLWLEELELLPVPVPSKGAEVIWLILEELPKPQPLMELTDQDSLLLPVLTLAAPPMIRHNNNNKHPSATGRKQFINPQPGRGFVITCNKRSVTQLSSISDYNE